MRRYFLILLDVCLVLLSTLVALALRENFALTEDHIEPYLSYLGATIIFSTIFIPAAGQPCIVSRMCVLSLPAIITRESSLSDVTRQF